MLKIKRTDLKISILFLSFVFFTSIPFFGQEECEQDLNSKTIKLLEKGKSKNTSRQERIDYLEEAIEIDENCLECNYLIGIDYFKKAKSGIGSYNSSEESFKSKNTFSNSSRSVAKTILFFISTRMKLGMN